MPPVEVVFRKFSISYTNPDVIGLCKKRTPFKKRVVASSLKSVSRSTLPNHEY